ncbi:MAG: response regulator [Aeromicrobium erythreum]
MAADELEPQSGDYWRIAIVEDHLLQRRRTQEILDRQRGLTVVKTFETMPELLKWVVSSSPRSRPHLVLLDLLVERGPSVDPVQLTRLRDLGIRVLVVSAMASPPLVREVVRAGIGGIVGKRDSEADLVAAVWTVLRRETWFTPELAAVLAGDAERPALSDQEERALVLYASGLTLDAVAAAIGVQPGTAKKYLTRVKEKYESAGRPMRTKIDMRREAQRDGLLRNT